jgi:hypothetical protein
MLANIRYFALKFPKALFCELKTEDANENLKIISVLLSIANGS